MYELSLAESVAELGRELWDDLEGPSDYPFLSYDWLLALEESGCLGAERGWIPRHVVIRRNKEVLAVAPAYIKLHSFGEFVFDQGWADFSETRLGVRYYPKMVLAVPFTPATGARILGRRGIRRDEWEGVLDLITGALPDLAERLGLSSVHILFPDGATSEALEARKWALRLGMQFQFHNPGYSGFEDYLAAFRSKRRAAIRRECREISKRGVSVEVLTGSGLDASQATLAHQLYLTTVDKHIWGRRYLTRGFFERILVAMPERLHFVLARDTSGAPIAGAFNLLGSEALYGRYWGTFVDMPFLHFNVCLYEGVKECVQRGLHRFEPGAGGAHKEGRGFVPTVTRSLHYLRDSHLDAAVRDFCAREADAIREHLESYGPGP